MTDQELYAKLKEIFDYPTMTNWSKGFVESVCQQVDKGYSLSERQKEVCIKIIGENTEEALEELKVWDDVYNRDWKEDAIKVANYYKWTNYYGSIVASVLAGSTPNRHAFMKMMNNKYAKKVLSELQKQPRFAISSHVIGNSKFRTGGWNFDLSMFEPSKTQGFSYDNKFRKDSKNMKERGGIILDIDDIVKSAVKGAKRYLVLPFGSTTTYWVEERYLKNKPKVKNK